MHRLQDYYSHYKKGYRWDPIHEQVTIPGAGWGHISETGPDEWLPPDQRGPDYNGSPDNDDKAWAEANKETKDQLKLWERDCCIKCWTECEWVPKSTGLCAPKPVLSK